MNGSLNIQKMANFKSLPAISLSVLSRICHSKSMPILMGTEAKDIHDKLRSGDAAALKKIKQNIKVSDKYKADN